MIESVSPNLSNLDGKEPSLDVEYQCQLLAASMLYGNVSSKR